ncbi:hypothetical protein SAVIM338S_05530 [Streptomyces avidinii]
MHHQRKARAIQRALRPCRPNRQISCGKTWFADRIAADLSLARISAHGRASGKEPIRSYLCPRCHGWHLTSAPVRRVHGALPRPSRRH